MGERWLPPIPKRAHECIIAWEFVDLGDLHQAGTWETLNPDPDLQQLVILRGIEVARAKPRPIKDVYTWIQCFAIYITAPFSKIGAFTMFAQPANTLTLLFTVLEHLGEGPSPQGQQPRRERKQRTEGPILIAAD